MLQPEQKKPQLRPHIERRSPSADFLLLLPVDDEEGITYLHAALQSWHQHPFFRSVEDTDLFYRMQLALHEWVANLLQHAEFPEDEPRIGISLHIITDTHVHCIVRDNSAGFNLSEALFTQQASRMQDFFQERGLGLLLLETIVDTLHYTREPSGWNCLQFVISIESRKCLTTPF